MAPGRLEIEPRGVDVHELSLCESIHDIVARAAGGRPVRTVHLTVGHLRQAVPESLVFCWAMATEGGVLAGSSLEIEEVPVTLSCRDCGVRSELADDLLMVCPACASIAVEPLTGTELLVTSIDVVTEEAGVRTGPSGDARTEG